MRAIHRILVPVDFSEPSREALHYAAFLAQKFDAVLHVLHVWEPPRLVATDLFLASEGGTSKQTLAQFARSRAGIEMEQFLVSLQQEFPRTKAQGMLDTGDPCETILRIATRDRYDLITLGTRGRTGLSRLLVGSVAERVVRLSPVPVVTLHAPTLQADAQKGDLPHGKNNDVQESDERQSITQQ